MVGSWTGPGVARDVCSPGSAPPDTCTSWAGTEFLLMWEKKQPLPAALVTTGSPTASRPGAPGQPGSSAADPALDPNNDGYGAFGGVRVFAGTWFDSHQNLGLEAGGFLLEDRSHIFTIGSNVYGLPLLALRHLDPPGAPGNVFAPPPPSVQGGTTRPFPGSTPDAFVITGPEVGGKGEPFTGGIAIHSDSQLWGAEGNILHALWWSPDFHLVALVGARYLNLKESLAIQTLRMARDGSHVIFEGKSFPPLGVDPKKTQPPMEAVLTDDSFQARDRFLGAQLGLRGEYFFDDRFFVRAGCTLDLGSTEEMENILGSSSLQPMKNAELITVPGGLYALPSNTGRFRNDDFAVVPEVQLQGGVLLTPWLRATVGYDFLYWSRVLRPGDQLDLTVDRRQVPTDRSFVAGTAAQFPQPLLKQTDFWLQGFTLGLEATY